MPRRSPERGWWMKPDPAGLPSQTRYRVLGRGESVGNALINHPKIGMVSITGDIATGKKVLQAAANTSAAVPGLR